MSECSRSTRRRVRRVREALLSGTPWEERPEQVSLGTFVECCDSLGLDVLPEWRERLEHKPVKEIGQPKGGKRLETLRDWRSALDEDILRTLDPEHARVLRLAFGDGPVEHGVLLPPAPPIDFGREGMTVEMGVDSIMRQRVPLPTVRELAALLGCKKDTAHRLRQAAMDAYDARFAADPESAARVTRKLRDAMAGRQAEDERGEREFLARRRAERGVQRR